MRSYSVAGDESPVISDIRGKLDALQRSNENIQIIWIPAHVGIGGNEMADDAAKRAARESLMLDSLISYSDLMFHFRKKVETLNDDNLVARGMEKGKRYFELYYSSSKKPWFVARNFSRKVIVTFNRIRSNHTSLKDSLIKFKIVQDNRCDCDMEIEDVEHIFWQCNRFKKEREEMI